MPEQLTKQYFNEQFDTLLKAVKGGFDHVDEEMTEVKTDLAEVKTDLADLKYRMRMVKSEIQALSANIVTKQYLDAKIDRIIGIQYQDTLFKKRLLLALEEAKVLTPEVRAKLEHLIPALTINE